MHLPRMGLGFSLKGSFQNYEDIYEVRTGKAITLLFKDPLISVGRRKKV